MFTVVGSVVHISNSWVVFCFISQNLVRNIDMSLELSNSAVGLDLCDFLRVEEEEEEEYW